MLLLRASSADVKKVCRTILRLLSGPAAAVRLERRGGDVTMDSGAFPLKSEYPVAIVGAGPVGLTTALALSYFEIPFVVFEANAGLSTETKAGTTLIRTLEVWQRFGAADRILSKAMRVDEIGDIERATNRKRDAVKLHLLRDETRFPFCHQPAAVRHGAGAARLPGRARNSERSITGIASPASRSMRTT